MNDKGKYLYCIIKEKKPIEFEITGQKEKKVYAVNQDNLAMVVSDSEIEEYTFIREHLTCHQKVIEEVMKEGYDVLPVRFGTVAKNIEDVKVKILKDRAEELIKTLKTVEGRVELGLRAIWKDMPNIFQEIVAENENIQRAKKQAQKNSNQFNVAAVGELVVEALGQKREKEAEKILDPLLKLAADFKERELLGDSMIFSYAFLVSKENGKEFDKKVEALIKRYNERIKLKYIGPIPPFNFVELHINV